jgi:triphosphoribosyl-dephospho-CoA synthase
LIAAAATGAGRSAWLTRAVIDACELELRALKPGNVGLHGGGHGMSAADFVVSAAAVAPPLAAPGMRVGERILAGVRARRRVVSCNTNLGIVLLVAPLAQAALAATPERRGLREALATVLADLDVDDARLAYEAIRLAEPGGLGRSARHDVAEPPSVTLMEAMREAAGRDGIARQYAEGFSDVLDLAVPLWRESLARWGRREWAATAVYLNLMAWLPDTLVARKFGAAAASEVAARAGELAESLDGCTDPDTAAPRLLEWDRELKDRGLNPGTSADLTVATMLAAAIEDALETEFTAAEPDPGLRGKMTGESSRVTHPTVQSRGGTPWQKSTDCASASRWSATATRSPTST